MDTAQIRAEWGLFRRFIATRPLTAFWGGVVLGGAIGTFVTWILP